MFFQHRQNSVVENGSKFWKLIKILKMGQILEMGPMLKIWMRVISSQLFFWKLEIMRPLQMHVISPKNYSPQIRASFTNDAHAWNARRYVWFTRGGCHV